MKPLISLTNDFTTEFLIFPISSLIRKTLGLGMRPNSANSQSGILAGGGRNHRETIQSREALRPRPRKDRLEKERVKLTYYPPFGLLAFPDSAP
jgi:hypothetical protein